MVRLSRFFVCVLLSAFVVACNQGNETLGGREGGAPGSGGGGGGGGGEKPKPNVVEGIRPLLLQKPTLSEDKFLNIMRLEFGEADQAAFTFTFSATRAGSLFFTNIQAKLHLEECTKEKARPVKFNVVWQEDLGTGRAVLETFTPDITEYTYEPTKKYMLTYALVDLKGDLSDCKSATLKFAAFDKNYSKSAE